MTNISVLTTDKLGKGLLINPVTSLLDTSLSTDSGNILRYGTDNGLLVSIESSPTGSPISWTDLGMTGNWISGAYGKNLRIGKDTSNNIWLEGVLYNGVGASIAANNYFSTIPSEYILRGYTESTSLYQLPHTIGNVILAGSVLVPYLKLQYYQGVMKFALSTAIPVGGIVNFPLCIIGEAA